MMHPGGDGIEGPWLDRFCTQCEDVFRTKDSGQFLCPKCQKEVKNCHTCPDSIQCPMFVQMLVTWQRSRRSLGDILEGKDVCPGVAEEGLPDDMTLLQRATEVLEVHEKGTGRCYTRACAHNKTEGCEKPVDDPCPQKVYLTGDLLAGAGEDLRRKWR